MPWRGHGILSKGSVLPSTGGMGAKVIYGVGAVLVLGAAVTLVSRKRAGERSSVKQNPFTLVDCKRYSKDWKLIERPCHEKTRHNHHFARCLPGGALPPCLSHLQRLVELRPPDPGHHELYGDGDEP